MKLDAPSTKRERTRLRILESGLKLLLERGSAHVRMEDVAKAAELTRQALYLHFATRTELMVALMDHLTVQRGLDQLFAKLHEAPDGRQMLLRGLTAHTRMAAEIHDVAMALDLARFDDEAAAAAWDDRMELRRGGVSRMAARLKAEGLLAPGWTAAQVVDALMTLISLRVHDDLTRGAGWSAETYERFLQTTAQAFLAPAKPPKKR